MGFVTQPFGSKPIDDLVTGLDRFTLNVERDWKKKREEELTAIDDVFRLVKRRLELKKCPLHVHDRYLNIQPWKGTTPNYKHYINASCIPIETNEGIETCIQTQGPTEQSYKDFFRLLISKKIPLIVNLTMPKERGRQKCYRYWEKEFTFKVDGKKWTFTPSKTEEPIGDSEGVERIFKRVFTLKSESETRKIIQLHYQNWGDFDPPNDKVFNNILEEADKTTSLAQPFVVHCSAGVGRAGTFVAAYALKKKKVSNIPKVVINLRSYRDKSIQTAAQLQAVYNFVLKDSWKH